MGGYTVAAHSCAKLDKVSAFFRYHYLYVCRSHADTYGFYRVFRQFLCFFKVGYGES